MAKIISKSAVTKSSPSGDNGTSGTTGVVAVPWDQTRVTGENDHAIMTVGLNPCVAVLFKAQDKNNKTITCLAHIPWISSSSFTNGRADHQQYYVQAHFAECKSKLAARGADVANLSVLMHAKEIGNPEESQNQTPAAMNAASIVDYFARQSEVKKFLPVYSADSELRTFKYDLTKQKYEIWSESEGGNENPQLLLTGNF